MILDDKRVRIVIGHYGSGKTEFSINYAVKLAELGKKVALVDLDVVNLYFRSREKQSVLEKMGIRVIGSSIQGSGVDIPAISAAVETPLQDKSYEAVLDTGGDPAGARALGRYVNFLENNEYDMFFVLNAYRPETQNLEDVKGYIKRIEDTARAHVTGIVNNTHMLKSTRVEDVVNGYNLAKEVSDDTGLPIIYNVCLESLVEALPKEIRANAFPIKLYMREEWML